MIVILRVNIAYMKEHHPELARKCTERIDLFHQIA